MRSTFSLSQADFDRIDAIRSGLARRGHILNKSEVVRLALICLEGAPAEQQSLLDELARLKPGRPRRKRVRR
jgi:hypothetical protein